MMMKAQVITGFGGPEVFREMLIPRPQVLPGHVLIRVAATSVNPADCKIRSGISPASPSSFPAVLHGDVAGIVEEVGEGVTKFRRGDEVFGCAGGVRGTGGALADYMLADARLIARKPPNLTMAEAAALPLVSITAWEGLFERARIEPGQTVLVHGGTGGVGHIAVQLAKHAGAKVYTTVSSKEKMEIAMKLGADAAILYTKTAVDEYVSKYTDGNGFDVVFDTVGGNNLALSFAAAALNGTVISISTRSVQDLTPVHNKGLSLHGVFMLIPLLHNVRREKHGDILSRLSELAAEGKIKPLLDPASYDFSRVGEAHRHLESGRAIGKVTLIHE